MKRKPYVLFMIREMTSVFVAGYCVFLLILTRKIAQGPEAYGALIAGLRSPLSVALHLVSLAFVLYHTVTWFNLTPKIAVVWRGEERVPAALIAGPLYLAWIGLSVLVAWIVLGG